MDIQGANLFFQLIARRYEKTSTVFTSNKTFSQWNEVFADVNKPFCQNGKLLFDNLHQFLHAFIVCTHVDKEHIHSHIRIQFHCLGLCLEIISTVSYRKIT